MKATIIDVETTRGDTNPIVFNFTDANGDPVVVTGDSFLLTVNREREPEDNAEQVFQITGAVIDGPNGKVSFTPDVTMADNVGAFYYDIQRTSGGTVSTPVRGVFAMKQDITK